MRPLGSPGDLAQEVRRSDADRYYAALLAPEPVRGDLLTLYAFNHEIAKVGETVRERMLGEIRLAWWEEALETLQRAAPSSIAAALARIVEAHALPKGFLAQMIAARRVHDLGPEPIETWSQFERYADQTAGVVLRLAARIAGAGAALDDVGIAGGRAWAVTGHLRSLSTNLTRHKLFLPMEAFTRHGLRSDDIFHLGCPETLRPAIAEITARAQAYLEASEQAWRAAPKHGFAAVGYLALARLYLKKMRRPQGNPATRVPEISPLRRIATLLSFSLSKRILV